MNDVTIISKNTVKMLRANGREAMNFGDACFGLVNYINPELKANARRVILGTKLLGESFEKHLENFHASAKKIEVKDYSTHPKGISIMMTLDQAKQTLHFGIVKEVLSQLITKQAHAS